MNQTEAATANEKKTLPDGWRWVRLGEVCEENPGSRDPRLEPDEEFQYADITSIDTVTKKIVAHKTLLGRVAPSRARQVIRTGDVLVATTRPNLNAVALVPHELDNQICSTGFCVLRPMEGLDSSYLFAFVQSTEFIQNLSECVTGALYPAVTDKQVRAQPIPFPPLLEQQRIAAILSEQLASVERARAATAAQLDAAKALPAAYLRRAFDSPEAQQWPKKRVSDVCEAVDYGYTASADFSIKEPRFLRITDIQNGEVMWDQVPGCQISSEGEGVYRLADGDIVFARTGATTGKSFLVRQPPRSVFASYLIRLRIKPDVAPEYLYGFFQSDSYWQQVRAHARGAGQPNVNATLLGSIEVPIPSLSDQRRIVAQLSVQIAAAERLRQTLAGQLDAVNALPAVLLRRAFRGEL